MQQLLQNLQFELGIYNSDVEPEHDSDYPCNCAVHRYQRRKWQRYGVQDMWSKAVMYPGEKAYNDNKYGVGSGMFSNNPYTWRVQSPYGYNQFSWGPPRPVPSYHARMIHQSIALNNSLNKEAQANIDAKEPKHSIWEDAPLEKALSNMSIGDKKRASIAEPSNGKPPLDRKGSSSNRLSVPGASTDNGADKTKISKMSSFRKSLGIKSSEERAIGKVHKAVDKGQGLREEILAEEDGRWYVAHLWPESGTTLTFSLQARRRMASNCHDLPG